MWRPASNFVLRRRSVQHRAIASIAFSKGPGRAEPEKIRRLCGFHRLMSSNGSGSGQRGGVGDGPQEDDDDDEEGWIPPARIQSIDGIDEVRREATPQLSPMSPVRNSKRIETILEVTRQVKEQERLDRAHEKTAKEADALFQLSEEEQESMTDEEILERLEGVLKREEDLEEEIFQKELEMEEERLQMEASTQQEVGSPDWLRNRRAVLGQDDEDGASSNSSTVVPIIQHTLLTMDEIKLLLETHGGEDIVVIEDDPDAPRMGGADGMIFCTGGGSSRGPNGVGSERNDFERSFINHSPHLISTLSRVLIDHMKDRKLYDRAPSAKQNTTHRAAISSPTIFGSGGVSGNPSESWRIVDCGNYVVHILDEATRWDLNLEDLWSGADPLWDLNIFDEDAIEEYCEKHPVPSSYDGTGSSSRDGGHRGDEAGEFVDAAAMKRLQRTRFGSNRRHRPVIPHAIRNRHRRIGRKKRREQRQQDYFGSFD
mmetsp:Transcript_1/g.5  ORF Transcript_1/g.5 Transcript_1/m.5 type:complete len:485 (-) Transcript_1:83-1537(-)